MSEDRFPPEKDGEIPLRLEEFLRPGRVALVLWDLQKRTKRGNPPDWMGSRQR